MVLHMIKSAPSFKRFFSLQNLTGLNIIVYILISNSILLAYYLLLMILIYVKQGNNGTQSDTIQCNGEKKEGLAKC